MSEKNEIKQEVYYKRDAEGKLLRVVTAISNLQPEAKGKVYGKVNEEATQIIQDEDGWKEYMADCLEKLEKELEVTETQIKSLDHINVDEDLIKKMEAVMKARDMLMNYMIELREMYRALSDGKEKPDKIILKELRSINVKIMTIEKGVQENVKSFKNLEGFSTNLMRKYSAIMKQKQYKEQIDLFKDDVEKLEKATKKNNT